MEKNDISIIKSLKLNYLSWIVIILSVIVVSYPFVNAGFITFTIIFLSSYFMHKYIHIYRNIITIVHHYHHENNNFLSHIAEIMFELSFCIAVIPCYYFLGDNYINIWSAFLFYLFYVTVHNINYGFFKINNVHSLHHKDMHTNHGPDICDVAFGTKNIENTEVEDTTHYIPNYIFSSLLILLIKHFYKYDNFKGILNNLLFIILAIIALFLTTTSIYLTLYYGKPINDIKIMQYNNENVDISEGNNTAKQEPAENIEKNLKVNTEENKKEIQEENANQDNIKEFQQENRNQDNKEDM